MKTKAPDKNNELVDIFQLLYISIEKYTIISVN